MSYKTETLKLTYMSKSLSEFKQSRLPGRFTENEREKENNNRTRKGGTFQWI